MSAPLVGLASRHAAVHRLLRPLILAARRTSSGRTVEREIQLGRPARRPRTRKSWPPALRCRKPVLTFRRTNRASTVGSITWVVVPAFAARCRTRRTPVARAFLGRLSQPLLHVLGRLSLADAVHQGRTNHAAPGQPVDPELRVETVPEEDHRGQERQRVDPERALGEEGTPELDLCDRPRLPGPGPPKEFAAFMTTHRRSDIRTARRRSRRPAPHSRSCGRRARSVRAPARTAPGPESSPASRAGRRAA